jgi:hypothetical protein
MPSHFGPTYAELAQGPPGPLLAATANNANPCQLNFGAVRHGWGDTRQVIVAGGTGGWAAVNSQFPVLIVDAFKVTIPVDTTALGAVTGSLTAKSAPIAQLDPTSYGQLLDNFKNGKENIDGGGFTYSNIVILPGSKGHTGSASLTFPAIASGKMEVQSFTVTGALPGDSILPVWPPTLESGLLPMAFVSGVNTVTVGLFNVNGFPVTPAVQVFSATAGMGSTPMRGLLTFPSIASGAAVPLTFPAVGALTSQRVMHAFPSTLEAGLFPVMRVPGPDLVEVRLLNTLGSAFTPAPNTWGAVLV